MLRHTRTRILVATAVVAIAGAAWFAADGQRVAANHSLAEIESADALLIALLEQEASLLAHAQSGRREFLARYSKAQQEFDDTLATARAGVDDAGEEEDHALAVFERRARAWQADVEAELDRARADPAELRRAGDAQREQTFASVRAAHDSYRRALEEQRTGKQARAGVFAVGLILLLSLAFALLGYVFVERSTRAEARHRERQADFGEALQMARTESEAYEVLKRHLERVVRGGAAIVLNRNNSANQLEPRTALPDGSRLSETLAGAEPASCLAIRTGASHSERAGAETLLSCEVCGGAGTNATCVPSLVGGEVIGAVLVEHPKPLREHESEHLRASVSEAAPVIANQRTLALAEMRAATDALTGLPNARAVQETLKRMVAQSSRTLKPLSALLFDLDHFKQVNDLYGHGKGDAVLAAVADAARSGIRASDFVGRYGGEEFLLLLPDTGREGALVLAEKLRAAFSALSIAGLERRVTASFGIAVMPDDAIEATELVRCADRALYAAKAAGRDRVVSLAPAEPAPMPALEPLELASASGAPAAR